VQEERQWCTDLPNLDHGLSDKIDAELRERSRTHHAPSRAARMVRSSADRQWLPRDAYAPMLGGKHPSMGVPLRLIWPEIWHQIGPMLADVVGTATPTWSEDQLLVLERNGFAEAGYFTYSFSPIRDESGEVAGRYDVGKRPRGLRPRARRRPDGSGCRLCPGRGWCRDGSAIR
jgi:hypothetical protein